MTQTPVPVAPTLALVHDRLGMDGRSYVVGWLLAALEAISSNITLFTLSSRRDAEQFLHWFEAETGRSVTPRLHTALTFPGRGYYARTLVALTLFGRRANAYDLVINAVDSPAFADPVRTLLYVHFPIERSVAHDLRQAGVLRRMYASTFVALHRLVSPRRWHTPVLTNSELSRNALLAVPRFADCDLRVASPPSPRPPVERPGPGNARRTVLSLGAISADKHLDAAFDAVQASVASRFHIVGAGTDARYLGRLRARTTSARVETVIVVDATPAEKRRLLSETTILLHAKPTEHLGIAILEGVAAGALPLVAATSGLGPLLPPECVFESQASLETRLGRLLALSDAARAHLWTTVCERLRDALTPDLFIRTVQDCARVILQRATIAS